MLIITSLFISAIRLVTIRTTTAFVFDKHTFLFFTPQGTPADVLYKGTITRLITEDSASRAERERDEALSKGHVLYEGISGHILTYDREYTSFYNVAKSAAARMVSNNFLLCFRFCVFAIITFHVVFLSFSNIFNNFMTCAGPPSQPPKDESRGPGQSGEVLGLKRPYDLMEGGISRGLPVRDSLSAVNCEGKTQCHLILWFITTLC